MFTRLGTSTYHNMSFLGGSLWLVPDPESACYKTLKSKIDELSSNSSWGIDVARPFGPHMTITSGITDYFLSTARKIDFPGYCFVHLDEVRLEVPEIRYKELVFGSNFL